MTTAEQTKNPTVTAEQRTKALDAIERLVSADQDVTVRAVVKAAGIRTEAANAVVSEWNAQNADAEVIPAAPNAVTEQFSRIWRAAFKEARDHFAAKESAYETQAKKHAQEFAALAADLDAANDELAETKAKADQETETLMELQIRLQRRMAEAEEAERQTAKLVEELKAQAAAAEERATKAEARADKERERMDAMLDTMNKVKK